MLDFQTEVLSRFTEWIYKSTEDLSISLIIYTFEVGSKLN